jgi:hypothetical protein
MGVQPQYSNHDFDTLCYHLDEMPRPIYNSAYIMTGNAMHGYNLKHYNHIAGLGELIQTGFFKQALACKSMAALFTLLNKQHYMGNFIAYQYAIDLNYTPIFHFDENDFCAAGVGAKRGIEKLLHGKRPNARICSYEDIISFYTTYQENLLQTYGLLDGWTNLFGRRLHMIDMQNCFCEVDKYARLSLPNVTTASDYRHTRIKNKYTATDEPYSLFFPMWWDLPQNQVTL